jgi:hypothetical protein
MEIKAALVRQRPHIVFLVPKRSMNHPALKLPAAFPVDGARPELVGEGETTIKGADAPRAIMAVQRDNQSEGMMRPVAVFSPKSMRKAGIYGGEGPSRERQNEGGVSGKARRWEGRMSKVYEWCNSPSW